MNTKDAALFLRESAEIERIATSGAPYRVMARRWRPQRLSEVVGQEVAVRTLGNALRLGRTSHAYLFTGTRGVGKTSLARILAKGLCCEEGPTAEPCGRCAHCVAIEADAHPDVAEIDAASRTGVDDVREITEGARYAPVSARRKVWIVDEAHMMSRQAFNALLKTLEQPPDEVVFILATTEPEKLPATIRSRCQTHALRRVPEWILTEHYAKIATEESISIDVHALGVIAHVAAGSVRDGLSIFDAIISSTEDRITEKTVNEAIGLADRTKVADLLDHVLLGETVEALDLFAELHAAGAEPGQLCADLLDHVLKRTRKTVRAMGAMNVRNRPVPLGKFAAAWQMLLKGCGEVQTAPRPEVALEMLLVRLCCVADLPTPGEVVAALEKYRLPVAEDGSFIAGWRP